jgi:hypothetical protein
MSKPMIEPATDEGTYDDSDEALEVAAAMETGPTTTGYSCGATRGSLYCPAGFDVVGQIHRPAVSTF